MPNLTEEILDINTLTEVTKVGGGSAREPRDRNGLMLCKRTYFERERHFK
jgi:hypothetical protein